MRERNRMPASHFNFQESNDPVARWETTVALGRAADPCLRLDFHAAPLASVLNYMRDAAGFILRIRPNVELERPLDVAYDQPLNKADALSLVRQALDEQGYTAIQDGRMLTIIRTADAKKTCLPIRLTAARPGRMLDTATLLNSSPSPCEERAGRGPGRGAT